MISPLSDILEDLKRGRMIILVDDEGRENEGDLTMAAEFATPEAVNFMARHGRGLICMPMEEDRIKALDVATNVLQSSPDLKAFYCANDTMALGVMQAVQNAGKAGKVLVVGTDGAPEAVEMVKAGRLSATVAQDPAKIGATSLDLLVEAVKAGKLTPVGAAPKQVAVDSVLVTK